MQPISVSVIIPKKPEKSGNISSDESDAGLKERSKDKVYHSVGMATASHASQLCHPKPYQKPSIRRRADRQLRMIFMLKTGFR